MIAIGAIIAIGSVILGTGLAYLSLQNHAAVTGAMLGAALGLALGIVLIGIGIMTG